MRCEEVHEHLTDFLAETLAGDIASHVRTHLDGCRECAEEAERLGYLWRTLGAIPIEPPDSAGMRKRFATMLDNYREALKTHRDVWQRGIAGNALRLATLAAMFLLGFGVSRLSLSSASDAQAAFLRSEVQDLRQLLMLSLLQQPSASERLRGVTLSADIHDPDKRILDALLDTLAHDDSVGVRLATIDALRRFAVTDAVRRGAAGALLRQSSPLVELALIDFVADIGDSGAKATLRRLADDPSSEAAVRSRAAIALQRIG